MRQGLTIEQLMRYCEEHEIAVPKTASKSQLEAAIARSYLHMQKVTPHGEIGCFGFFDDDDMNCRFCSAKERCHKSSVGLSADAAKRLKKTLERLRFAEPERRSR